MMKMIRSANPTRLMRHTLLILAMLLSGCDRRITRRSTVVEPDTRPAFVLNASKPFVIEFGRGSGSDSGRGLADYWWRKLAVSWYWGGCG